MSDFSLLSLFAQPIPAAETAAKTVLPLEECGEPLVSLPDSLPFLRCLLEYRRRGVAHALEVCYVRAGVLARLELAARQAGSLGVGLTVWDAWRSVDVQQALYDGYQAELRRQYPGISAAELEARTREFVALPSRDPARASPHLTGGAIDVTLSDAKGNLLPMGTDYDDFTPRAATRYFEPPGDTQTPHSALSPEDFICRNHRRLLYHLMSAAGFTNYEAEWWHFDYGNRLWARQGGYAPIYGAAEPSLRAEYNT